jgi:hypothetical protein
METGDGNTPNDYHGMPEIHEAVLAAPKRFPVFDYAAEFICLA